MNQHDGTGRSIAARQDLGATAVVRQGNDLRVRSFVADQSAIILLRRGRKTIWQGGRRIVLSPGDAVAIAAGTRCDVQNQTERGAFESAWIVWADAVLRQAQAAFPTCVPLDGALALKDQGTEFVQAFDRVAQAISLPDTLPALVAAQRGQELLAWLAHAGRVFPAEPALDLRRRVRLMIGAAPGQPWRSGAVAQALAMSEATFRRRLAAQGQSFNDLLIDVRMATALTLLQVTDRPVAEIALHVGYESASRFAVRFRQRFGFPPAAVRGAANAGRAFGR